ncbi:MAG TPA: hypothetical protein VNZ86_10510 [Bacteroidia bacterium]|nr:hypothetical protein [Bacteroidia bacterium]
MDIYYFRNGRLKQKDISVRDPKSTRFEVYVYVFVEERCENGNLIYCDSLSPLKAATHIRYHCNGKKEMEYTVWQSNRIGPFREWYENDQLKIQGQFDETIPLEKTGFVNASKKQGLWVSYDEQGNVMQQVRYKDGTVVGSK